MNELSQYENLIDCLLELMDKIIPLEFAKCDPVPPGDVMWEGRSRKLIVTATYTDISTISITDSAYRVLEAEELSISNIYTLVGKFIDMEA